MYVYQYAWRKTSKAKSWDYFKPCLLCCGKWSEGIHLCDDALRNGKVCNIPSRQLSSKLILICPLTKWLCIVCQVFPSNIFVPKFKHHTAIGVCIWFKVILLLYKPNPLDGRAFASCCMFGTSNGFSPSMLWVMGFCGVVVLWLHQLDSPLSRLQRW